MQYIDEHGCLTQRSQLDRLRELAEGTARERVKALAPTELLPTTAFVVDPGGKESMWDLDHLAVAGSSSGSAVQLLLDPELALDNLVPTQALMRILRNTAASAVAVVAPVNASAAALQLADLDHERGGAAEEQAPPAPVRPPIAAAQPSRPVDPAAARLNLRREMREQLHRPPVAAPSWLQ